jgi:hypothetical protein
MKLTIELRSFEMEKKDLREIAEVIYSEAVGSAIDAEDYLSVSETDFIGSFEDYHYFDAYAHLSARDQAEVVEHFYELLNADYEMFVDGFMNDPSTTYTVINK